MADDGRMNPFWIAAVVIVGLCGVWAYAIAGFLWSLVVVAIGAIPASRIRRIR